MKATINSPDDVYKLEPMWKGSHLFKEVVIKDVSVKKDVQAKTERCFFKAVIYLK